MTKETIENIKNAAAILGRLGGKARARKLSKERMSEIGRMGAKVTNRRWYLHRKRGYRGWKESKKNA